MKACLRPASLPGALLLALAALGACSDDPAVPGGQGGEDGVGGDTPGATSSAASGTSSTSSEGAGGQGGAGNSSGGAGPASSASTSSGGAGPASSASTSSGGPGGGGPGEAEIVAAGDPAKILLRGTVVTPDVVFEGEVLTDGDLIACAAPSCADHPSAKGATIVETHGTIFPGLVDAHNHILFDVFDEDDWTPSKVYDNHNQWNSTSDAQYGALVDAKQHLNGESGSPVSLGCEMNKYGELKGLVAGTTSIVGAANPANKHCYGSLARTIDQGSNDLEADKVQVATLFPTKTSGDAACKNIASDKTDAYVIHVAEGVDETARKEFDKLGTVTTEPGCLHAPETTIVHGTALGAPELDAMAKKGMSLVWSPRSNVFLYGGGTDLKKTTDIPSVLSRGINVAVAPDWSIGGSQNILDELRFADAVDDSVFGDILSPKDLVLMATKNAARALALEGVIGSLEAGKKADLFVIGPAGAYPSAYDALLDARPRDVRLVLVGGVALYGDPAIAALGPASPGCEALDVCARAKFVCVAEAGGTATNKLGQTFAEIVSTLEGALADYDAKNLSPWDFFPIAPLVKCAP